MNNSRGEKIKQLRKEANLTQQEFAEKIGVARSTLAGYETGTIAPRFKVVCKVCEEFNIPLSHFYSDDASATLEELRSNDSQNKTETTYDVAFMLKKILIDMQRTDKVAFDKQELTENQIQLISMLVKASLDTYSKLLKEDVNK